MSEKSSQSEVDQRVHAVYLLLLRRETTQKIVHYSAQSWGVGERQAKDYIARARELMRTEAKAERADALAEHVAIRRDLFNKAYKDKKWAIAFQIAQDEAKLIGLYFNLEDHLKAAIAAGYDVIDPTTVTEEETQETL